MYTLSISKDNFMENDQQVFKPNQNNINAAPSPAASEQPARPSPQPQVPSPVTTPYNPSQSWSPTSSSSNKSGAYGRLSLLLSSSAVGIFILLIFVNSLVDSLTKTYIWFFVILALGVAGLALGLLSEKNKEKISLLGLVGIVVSVIVLINCLTIGSYYIKIQVEINKYQSQFNSSSGTDLDSSNIYEGF